ncbi:acyl carrier protein [Rhizobium phage RHph_X2_24]|nr:acyl carrier protein [Rhizobium phage RHph_X2_24]
MKERIIETIKRHVPLAGAETPVEPATTLEALGFDSLDKCELMIALETECDIEIDSECVNAWSTVQDVIETVENAAP